MILGLDVSDRLGLVTLELPGGRLLSRVSEVPREHTAFLQRVLAGLREEAGRPWSDLARVAVTVGPGSFTGLRVGLATAKGLAFGRDVEVAPLASLALPVLALPAAPGPTLACRRARGQEVWAALFAPGADRPEWEDLLDAAGLAVHAAAAAAAGARLVGTPPPGTFPAEAPLAVLPEPGPAEQLAALARLARLARGALRGEAVDALQPRYLLRPATSRPAGGRAR
ncbi:MAG: tRNA (adenosine(37)-N6)-threonylcarbamoyltransferase complex dimerization subunit type 1 TsaB [Candidatus Krumholzibacteriota bacterium]|nr:tRNA (adenosine(37)-N6)-threonylcarbamoyltransferase complex dimerization subunit type 1 TsaB [Candidatus Krumholzibacteriota bacterium]